MGQFYPIKSFQMSIVSFRFYVRGTDGIKKREKGRRRRRRKRRKEIEIGSRESGR